MSSTGDAVAVIKKHEKVLHAIVDLFEKHNITPQDGEEILAVLLGISMGQRLVSLTAEQSVMLDRIAAGWVIAASEA